MIGFSNHSRFMDWYWRVEDDTGSTLQDGWRRTRWGAQRAIRRVMFPGS